MSSPSISQIAKKINVSKATVSRAFNYSKEISEATRNDVFRVAAELGYVHNIEKSRNAKMLNPTSFQKSVIKKKSCTISLINYRSTREIMQSVPYYKNLIRRLEETFRSEGISLIEAYPQNDTEYLRIVAATSSDAILILGNIQEMSDELVNQISFAANQQPLIFLSNYPKHFQNRFHSVCADDTGVGYAAAKYSCKTDSEHILFVDSGFGMEVVENRYYGYKRALEEVGRNPVIVPFNDHLWNTMGLSSGLQDKISLPKGKLCFIGAADSTIFFFVDYLKKCGLFDPSSMRFIGMDGIPELTPNDIRSATISVDLEAMALESFNLINDSLNGKILKPKTILTGCELKTKKGEL